MTFDASKAMTASDVQTAVFDEQPRVSGYDPDAVEDFLLLLAASLATGPGHAAWLDADTIEEVTFPERLAGNSYDVDDVDLFLDWAAATARSAGDVYREPEPGTAQGRGLVQALRSRVRVRREDG